MIVTFLTKDFVTKDTISFNVIYDDGLSPFLIILAP
jgi:hypothetical protein